MYRARAVPICLIRVFMSPPGRDAARLNPRLPRRPRKRGLWSRRGTARRIALMGPRYRWSRPGGVGLEAADPDEAEDDRPAEQDEDGVGVQAAVLERGPGHVGRPVR